MKAVKRFVNILIAIMIMMTLMSGMAFAEDGIVLSGEGTEASPYEVSSADDLDQMVSMVNSGEAADKYYILTSDIKVTADSVAPIGSQTIPFTGNFDGQGHKITGFRQRLTADDGNYGGLFGYANNAVIKNVTMESVNINNTGSSANAGGIVGYMNGGILSNVKVSSGSVSSGYFAGGIVGYLNLSGTLTGFENGATVSGTSYSRRDRGMFVVNEHDTGTHEKQWQHKR